LSDPRFTAGRTVKRKRRTEELGAIEEVLNGVEDQACPEL